MADGGVAAVKIEQLEGARIALTERTSGGLVGKLAGKVKEAAGSLTGNQDLAREGRLQEAQSDAGFEASREAREASQREQQAQLVRERDETELERERLENEVAEQEREARAERDREVLERQVAAQEQEEKAQAERERAAKESSADRIEESAEAERLDAAREAIRLEQEARRVEAKAETTDPKE